MSITGDIEILNSYVDAKKKSSIRLLQIDFQVFRIVWWVDPFKMVFHRWLPFMNDVLVYYSFCQPGNSSLQSLNA